MGKRHCKGTNSSLEKKRRREHAEKWKNTRGDDNKSLQLPTQNARFEAFYKCQLASIRSRKEFDQYLSTLRSPLPACFRINPDYPFADELRSQLSGHAGNVITVDGQDIHPVEELKWYPRSCGFKLGTDRRSIRKLEALDALHKWLMLHTDNGNVTRQEAVSMVPPLALNVQPHHKCLDMCAAPGSKTTQMLEIINRSTNHAPDMQGLVVANDADTDRAYMLVHQCRRLYSPHLMVTTHMGQLFPRLCASGADGSFDRVLCDVPCSGDGTLRKNPAIWEKWSTYSGMSLHPLQLSIAQRGLQLLKTGGLLVYSTCSMSPYEDEAVVAELLRSANGALELVDAREYVPLFNARPGMSNWVVLDDTLALKQEAQRRKEAAWRNKKNKAEEATSAAAAAVSTPSESSCATAVTTDAAAAGDMNCAAEVKEEVQDDAKVEEEVDDEVVEEEESDVLPELAQLLQQCLALGMEHFPSFADVPAGKKAKQSMFPPTAEEAEWMHLEKCMRCLPHDEDTGGFFVATLRKTSHKKSQSIPAQQSETEQQAEASPVAVTDCAVDSALVSLPENVDINDEESAGRPQQRTPKGVVKFQQWDSAEFQQIKDFYGLAEPMTAECFYVRDDFLSDNSVNRPKHVAANQAVGSKSVYYIPATLRQLMKGDKDDRLKIVCAGMKVLERKTKPNGEFEYRFVQEGIHVMVPHITSRKISVNIQDFCNMLGGGLVSFSTLSAETIMALSPMTAGTVVCMYEFKREDQLETAVDVDEPQHAFHAICWKGHTRTINVMCSQLEIESLKHQLQALRVLRPKISAVREVAAEAVAVADTAPLDSSVVSEVIAPSTEN